MVSMNLTRRIRAMHRVLIFLCFNLLSGRGSALNINNVVVEGLTNHRINVSVTTEAEELYYFQNWHYDFSGNELSLDVLFVKGFGSSISILNNNFEIVMDPLPETEISIKVSVFYTNFDLNNRQDQLTGIFHFPGRNVVLLKVSKLTGSDLEGFRFANSSRGELIFDRNLDKVFLFDERGVMVQKFEHKSRVFDISNMLNGLYYMLCFVNSKEVAATLLIGNQ